MTKEILIIGVDPPCPRCDLTHKRVERLIDEMGLAANVRHLVYDDQEALQLAASIGKRFGTPKHIAEKAGVNMGDIKSKLGTLEAQNRHDEFDNIDSAARRWSPDMDEILRPFQMKAELFGMLMTPILFVFGEMKHYGSVPSIEQLKSWLS